MGLTYHPVDQAPEESRFVLLVANPLRQTRPGTHLTEVIFFSNIVPLPLAARFTQAADDTNQIAKLLQVWSTILE